MWHDRPMFTHKLPGSHFYLSETCTLLDRLFGALNPHISSLTMGQGWLQGLNPHSTVNLSLSLVLNREFSLITPLPQKVKFLITIFEFCLNIVQLSLFVFILMRNLHQLAGEIQITHLGSLNETNWRLSRLSVFYLELIDYGVQSRVLLLRALQFCNDLLSELILELLVFFSLADLIGKPVYLLFKNLALQDRRFWPWLRDLGLRISLRQLLNFLRKGAFQVCHFPLLGREQFLEMVALLLGRLELLFKWQLNLSTQRL